MITKNRLHGAIATVLLVASTAYAQEEPSPTLTPSPGDAARCEAPDASCPPQEQTPTLTPAPGDAARCEAPYASCPPQGQPQMPGYAAPPPPPPPVVQTERPWYDRVGYGLTLGGGVDDFVGRDFRSVTHIGGGWGVRVTFGTHLPFAVEASYIGSAQGINAIGLPSDTVLVGNGLQGAVRWNILRMMGLQPFIYVGGAWRHYSLANNEFNLSDVRNSDDVAEVPMGLGVAGYVGGFMAEVRGEYRGSFNSDLIPAFEINERDQGTLIGDADRWGVTGNLGVEF